MIRKTETLREYFDLRFFPALTCTSQVKANFTTAVDAFLRYRGENPDIEAVTPDAIATWQSWLVHVGGLTAQTAKSYAKHLRRVVRDYFQGKNTAKAPEPEVGTLARFLTDVYLLDKQLAKGSALQLELSVRMFDRWLGRHVLLAELTDDLLNRWLRSIEGTRAPKTIKRRRGDVLAIWRHAHRIGVDGAHAPGYVRTVKVSENIPQAWTRDEFGKLIAAARRLDGYLPNGINRGLFWEGYLRVAYDTALRLGDMFRIERDWIDDDGRFRIVVSKTGREKTCRLRTSTLEAIDKTYPPERKLLFDWPFARETFFGHWRAITAGLPEHRRFGPNRLRHTSASHLGRVNPGFVRSHLGHSSESLALKYYCDPDIAEGEIPLPPSMDEEGGAQ